MESGEESGEVHSPDSKSRGRSRGSLPPPTPPPSPSHSPDCSESGECALLGEESGEEQGESHSPDSSLVLKSLPRARGVGGVKNYVKATLIGQRHIVFTLHNFEERFLMKDMFWVSHDA